MLGRQFHPVFLDVLMVCFIGSLQVSLSSYFLVTYLTKFDTDDFQTEGVPNVGLYLLSFLSVEVSCMQKGRL